MHVNSHFGASDAPPALYGTSSCFLARDSSHQHSFSHLNSALLGTFISVSNQCKESEPCKDVIVKDRLMIIEPLSAQESNGRNTLRSATKVNTRAEESFDSFCKDSKGSSRGHDHAHSCFVEKGA